MKRNKYTLSHYKLLTMDMGKLIPVAWYETLPGDSIQQATSMLVRCNPLVAPVMHPIRIRLHHWYVPLRLIWDGFEDFITGEGGEGPTNLSPYSGKTDVLKNTLDDYLGIKPASYSVGDPESQFNILPHRAYQLIWNEFYRDQDLQDEAFIAKGGGLDPDTHVNIQNVAWEKDYFTTARPWAQKGTEITIPFEGPVIGVDDLTPRFDTTTTANHRIRADNQENVSIDGTGPATTESLRWAQTALGAQGGIKIDELRTALALQRYAEARSIYGSRYVEYLRYLGVRSSDARINRPEYLGGGRSTIQFSEVLRTGSDSNNEADEGNYPIGEMLGHGITAGRSRRFRRYFEENGIVMTLMSAIPKTIYADSTHRSFGRMYKEDYFQKELQYIGEQEILNREVMADHSDPGGIFGYQARYDEYKTHPSSIAGDFRDLYQHWHLARMYESDPALNESFIACNPSKRIQADEEAPALIVMANHSIQARRMISRNTKGRTF